MNLAEIIFGQIPEAIYFVLFLIFTKNIKEKRFLFILIECIEYIILFSILKYSIYAHIIFFILTFCLMKMLYKEKCQITDVFTLGVASITLIPISIISYMTLGGVNMLLATILNRFLMILFLVIFKNKLCRLNNLYKRFWNRNNLANKKMKSTTFRVLNVILFNIMFYIINFGAICALIMKVR